jgi:hypothetical protein
MYRFLQARRLRAVEDAGAGIVLFIVCRRGEILCKWVETMEGWEVRVEEPGIRGLKPANAR